MGSIGLRPWKNGNLEDKKTKSGWMEYVDDHDVDNKNFIIRGKFLGCYAISTYWLYLLFVSHNVYHKF